MSEIKSRIGIWCPCGILLSCRSTPKGLIIDKCIRCLDEQYKKGYDDGLDFGYEAAMEKYKTK
jgi:hypothetical protein